LQKLEGKALTKRPLTLILRVDSKQLYRDGLNELMAAGLVENNRRVGGYFRPDAPPEKFKDYFSTKEAETKAPPKAPPA
jgi:hypothetical protein